MKRKIQIIVGIIVILVIACGGFAIKHLTSRDAVKAGTVKVEANGNTTEMELSKLKLSKVEGTIVNGKGEEKQISEDGILLSEALASVDVKVGTKVVVYADDEFSAEVTADEVSAADIAYITVKDDTCTLVVFGDKNSKRNVRNVVKVVVE